MSDHNRWSIPELITRYELEPSLKDVFVEGTYDYEILSNCYRTSSQKDRVVYDINSVEVPNELLSKHGLTSGNKQRVIALARELAAISDECFYRCIVDPDLDHWFDKLETTPRLVWMDFCSIELYFFSEEVITNLLISTAKSKIDDINGYIESLVEVLSTLYALRLADRQMNTSLSWLTIDRCLIRDKNKINFDVEEYLNRILLDNKKISLKDDFYTNFMVWKKKLTGDPKNYMRGHDFVSALAWTIDKFRGLREFANESTIERVFVMLSPNQKTLVNFLKFETE